MAISFCMSCGLIIGNTKARHVAWSSGKKKEGKKKRLPCAHRAYPKQAEIHSFNFPLRRAERISRNFIAKPPVKVF